MPVIGTAGHVDHGKSTLVKAITGIDPDRLKEEKAREMTIDLGFAWLTLPSGMEVSIVDVPGHERFIRNMLAGAGGVDLALMVVAADEGPMPQTLEHLDILRFLGVPAMVVALTKVDLVDEAWLELVSEEVRDLLRATPYEGATMVPVSARTGAGLAKLVEILDSVLKQVPAAKDIGRPRLPIDRSFTVAGFGTVVTGTLTGGTLRVGQEVEIVPGGIRARIRGLQSHRKRVDLAQPGTRVAVNLAGVESDQLSRGMVLTPLGMSLVTQRFFARVRVSPLASVELGSGMKLECYLGTAETMARLRLLEGTSAAAGSTVLAELYLSRPLAVHMGDRFILRRPSPSLTVAGGVVLDASAAGWVRRSQIVSRLELLEDGSPRAKVLGMLPTRGGIQIEALWRVLDISAEELEMAVAELVKEGHVVFLGGGPEGWLMSSSVWRSLCARVTTELEAYHKDHPMRPGMPKEQMRSKLRLDARLGSAVLQRAHQEGVIIDQGSVVLLPGHSVRLTDEQERQAQRFLQALKVEAFNPPSPAEFGLGSELLAVLESRGDVVVVTEGIVFHREAFEAAVEIVHRTLEDKGSITVADLRDLLATSRKYALALLEYMDRRKITVRVGDARVKR